jgi:hypothetical protein
MPSPVSPFLRRLQWFGLVLFAASAFMPSFPFQVGTPDVPQFLQPGSQRVVLIGPPGEQRVPAQEVARAVDEAFTSERDAFWSRRPLYAYVLLPLWVLALLIGRNARRFAGALLWMVTGLLVVLEAMYLKTDYHPFLPGMFGRLETALAWGIVITILVWRRRADRKLGAFEASVGAQALLGLVHGFTLPSTFARDLVGQIPFEDLLRAVGDVFAPGFWIGMAGLFFAALPAYLGRRGAA